MRFNPTRFLATLARFKKSRNLAAIALAVSGIASAPLYAGVANSTLAVSATVLQTCVVIATPMLFNNYTIALVDTTAVITVTCTADVGLYNVALDAGSGGGTTSNRKMTSGGSSLNYGLYRDSGHTQNWGNVPTVDTVASTAGVGTVIKLFTVYGYMPPNQTAAAGLYSDIVNVAVNY